MQWRRVFSLVSTSSQQLSTSIVAGTSTNACLSARIAASATGAWSFHGTQAYTTSTPSHWQRSLYATGPRNSRAGGSFFCARNSRHRFMAASSMSQNAAISTPGMKARRLRAYVPREPTPTTPTRTRASGGATKLLIAPAPPIFGRALAHPPAARAIAASPVPARKSLLLCP